MQKLQPDHTYDALYISDIHYLVDVKIKMNSHKELFELLDELTELKINFRKIFLVGDIIENWFFSAARKIKKTKERKRLEKLFDRFDQLSAPGGEKVYIIGNHDSTSIRLKLPDKVENFLEERKWQYREVYETPHVVIIHGHQGQYPGWVWTLNVFLTRIIHVLALVIPRLLYLGEAFFRKYINYDKSESHESVIAFYASLSHKTHQGDRLLICGHTHQFLGSGTLKVINTGDWIDSKTFVVQDKETFTGFHYVKPGKLKQRFQIQIDLE